ncbi:MAG: hypothetical protein Q9160_006045 [Pyrenula sp. 1 TL-2023]
MTTTQSTAKAHPEEEHVQGPLTSFTGTTATATASTSDPNPQSKTHEPEGEKVRKRDVMNWIAGKIGRFLNPGFIPSQFGESRAVQAQRDLRLSGRPREGRGGKP